MIIKTIINTETNMMAIICEDKDCTTISKNADIRTIRDIIKECEEMPDTNEDN